MLKMIQMMTWMRKNGLTLNEMMDEMREIIDNDKSSYFDLKGVNTCEIGEYFDDDQTFETAMNISGWSY